MIFDQRPRDGADMGVKAAANPGAPGDHGRGADTKGMVTRLWVVSLGSSRGGGHPGGAVGRGCDSPYHRIWNVQGERDLPTLKIGSSGPEVEKLQRRLAALGFDPGGADGRFGMRTDAAVRDFQASAGLGDDGVVGELTRTALFPDGAEDAAARAPTLRVTSTAHAEFLAPLVVNHNFNGGVRWRLAPDGIRIAGAAPETTRGAPQTVARVWRDFGRSIKLWGGRFDVPVELIVATICTESRGNSAAVREEPGYVSDEQTPDRVSPGLMQTLISTAREAVGDTTIDRAWLLEADNSIRAGTAYIDRQRRKTKLDPPKVACAYNAGRVIANNGVGNRWKMRQFPIGTGKHADRFVEWFNDCFRLFERDGITPPVSFRKMLQGRPQA